jgi:hypothetical protein
LAAGVERRFNSVREAKCDFPFCKYAKPERSGFALRRGASRIKARRIEHAPRVIKDARPAEPEPIFSEHQGEVFVELIVRLRKEWRTETRRRAWLRIFVVRVASRETGVIHAMEG